MARLSALLLALALGAACAVALVSCGSGDDANLLPGTTADEIEANLDAVEQLAAEQDCFGAEDAVAQVAAEVEELEGVDVKLKRALEDGTAKLSEVVGRCEEETEETEPTVETAVEPEEVEDEKEKKPKKEKPDKEKPAETEEEPAEGEGPELPPQANGKGEEKGGGPPPAETEPEETAPSGGVGPGVGVE
jgi:outer membrane biosynthesis protein TonB